MEKWVQTVALKMFSPLGSILPVCKRKDDQRTKTALNRVQSRSLTDFRYFTHPFHTHSYPIYPISSLLLFCNQTFLERVEVIHKKNFKIFRFSISFAFSFLPSAGIPVSPFAPFALLCSVCVNLECTDLDGFFGCRRIPPVSPFRHWEGVFDRRNLVQAAEDEAECCL